MGNSGCGSIFPLEVVNIILGTLDKREMLECRLISESWNQLCLKHLKRGAHVQELSVGKVKEFADFFKKSRTTPLFPLKIQIDQIFTHPLAEDVDSLISCVGPNSVVELDLKLRDINSQTSTSICSLLEKLAPELLSLSLTEPTFETWARQDFLARIRAMIFPKLEVLCMQSILHWGALQIEVFSILLVGCPILKVLDVSGSLQAAAISHIRISFKIGLKTLKLRGFKEPNALLQDIRNVSASQIALESFTCEFWDMSISNNWTLPQCQAMREIMEELSPKIRSFSYSIQRCYQHLMTSSFPVLATLNLYLSKLETCLDFTGFVNPIPSSLSPILLPSLKRVSFPIGIYWNAPDDLPVNDSVLELTFQAHMWKTPTLGKQYISAAEIQNCLSNAFRAFPKATRLTLRNPYPGLALRKLLLGLIQCPNAEGICELTVKDYWEDYIGKNFLQLTNPPVINIVIDKRSLPVDGAADKFGMARTISSCFDRFGGIDFKITEDSKSLRMETSTHQLLEPWPCFRNVSKLTLLLPPNGSTEPQAPAPRFQLDLNVTDYSQFVENAPSPQNILYLDNISKCFPNLRILEMSAGIL